ncbi:hypothetical protein [Cohnella soli]|uniref:Uncharacterized protein n=1 Tax=Cohnella soli TaxID=425005 RepID=A0ABW0HP32_9BACL
MTYHLYHYFEKDHGPFRNLSKLPIEEATHISHQLRSEGDVFASRRSEEYMLIRREIEQLARCQFIAKGGMPKNTYPHYMTLGPCKWLESWYRKPAVITIPSEEFSEESISFTYGDLFPTMRYQDEKPYRKQIYSRTEILNVIKEYGFPQDWNINGDKGPERYIEVQVWDEEVVGKYIF